jgi:DNA-binding NtrC family response regulator
MTAKESPMLVRLLLAVDDEALRHRLAALLAELDVVVSEQPVDAFWQRPERDACDLVVVRREDLPEPAADVVERLRRLPERPEVVVLRGADNAGDIARLQAAGCFAIVPRELPDTALGKVLAKLVERRRETVLARVRVAQAPPLRFQEMVSGSPATQRLYRLAARVAPSDTSLLLLGETGTGKDFLARAVHGESPRSGGPFVAINCGAVPEGLLESELFGHEKGAFTGATRARRGHFELAHCGTLYLDEIAEMPGNLQVKLLRALQERAIQRLGGETPVEVDVRIIAATHRDLSAAIREGAFRQDLYYRLAVVTLTVPALRERRDDVPELVSSYLEKFVRKLGRAEIGGVAAPAMEAMRSYAWPGNVRELINVVERAVLLCEGEEIDLVDLPAEISGITSPSDAGEEGSLFGDLEDWLERPLEAGREAVVVEFERRYLGRLLERYGGNVGKTAERAGIDPRTLYSKMRQLDLRKEAFKKR